MKIATWNVNSIKVRLEHLIKLFYKKPKPSMSSFRLRNFRRQGSTPFFWDRKPTTA